MKRSARGLLLLASLGLAVSSSVAYVLSDARWRDGTATIHIGLSGTAPSGLPFRAALEDVIADWNTTPFRFVPNPAYLDPCTGYRRSSTGRGFPAGNGDGLNSMDFRPDVCGNDFGSDVLAITLNMGRRGTLGFDYIAEADVIFNTGYSWNIYAGPRRSTVDFQRVALHELGHVLGLGHESTANAIMAPKISDLDALTQDDLDGAALLYGEPKACPISALTLNTLRRDNLGSGDCTVRQLYGFGNDTSLVDTYRLDLAQATTLRLRMASSSLDSVLLVTDDKLNPIEVFDDSGSNCNVDEQLRLPAGKYLLLANTYQTPEKCGGNTGGYNLAVSDSPFPLLGNTGNTRAGGALSAASFSGWARLDTGAAAVSTFAATDRFTVEGRINPDPAHAGRPARLYVLAILSNGQQLMQLPSGQFVKFPGLGKIQAVAQRTLAASEAVVVVQGLQGSTAGLAGLGVQIYLGYALDTDPQDIHFGAEPIAFSIAR